MKMTTVTRLMITFIAAGLLSDADAFLLTHRVHNRLQTVRGVSGANGMVGVAIDLNTFPAFSKALSTDWLGTVWDTSVDIGSTAFLGWAVYEGIEWIDEQINDDKEKDTYNVTKEAPKPLSTKSSAVVQDKTATQVTDGGGSNYNFFIVGDNPNICLDCDGAAE